MTADDETALLFWRNLITQWHLDAGLPDCGCDDETPDHRLCASSVAWADARYSERDDPKLSGPEDRWNHDMWKSAWGRNAPLLASPADFRLPMPPDGAAWLVRRLLVGGQCAVELLLFRQDEKMTPLLGRVRVQAEPSTVIARAQVMLHKLDL